MTSGVLVREGHVVAHDGAMLEFALATPCHSCRSPCLLGSRAEPRVQVASPGGSQLPVGERAQIAVSRAALTRTCTILFGVPLFAWVGGGVLGSLAWGDTGGVLLALVMLAGVLIAIHASRLTLRRWLKIELIAPRGDSDVEQTLQGSLQGGG